LKSATHTDIVFIAAKRTPFGTFGGTLKDQTATDLGVHAAKAVIAQAAVPAERYGHVVFGNVAQTSSDAIYLARHVGLRAGLPISTPALTTNRLCGSSIDAIVQGARLLAASEADVVLVGGTESMSQAPLIQRNTRWGFAFGKPPPLEDSLWSALTDSYAGMPMALTAEKLAEQYQITQDQVDEYSVRSQRRFAAAQESGKLAEELAPMELSTRKGPVKFARDEHNRPDTTLESLKKLPKVFKKDGVIHAGAASGISDGAAALVMTTRGFADKHGAKPIARLVNWAYAGVDPSIMGIGPVVAFRNVLERTQTKLSEYDLFEVNEAFAPQVLAVERELGLPPDLTNVNGGAIAVGHPLGASGARVTMHLAYELRRRGARYGIAGACIGGGQGMALAIEALP
jgi:acetyl-CoA acyltransferase 2